MCAPQCVLMASVGHNRRFTDNQFAAKQLLTEQRFLGRVESLAFEESLSQQCVFSDSAPVVSTDDVTTGKSVLFKIRIALCDCAASQENLNPHRLKVPKHQTSGAAIPPYLRPPYSVEHLVAQQNHLFCRIPAVSKSFKGMPLMLTASSIVSRVVPGISVTIARAVPTSALSKLDFPTFGLPNMATLTPSEISLPSVGGLKQYVIKSV